MERQRRRGYLKPDFKLMYVTGESYTEIPTTEKVTLDRPNKYSDMEEEVPKLIQMPELLTMRSFLKKKEGHLLYKVSTQQFVFAPFSIKELMESMK